MRNDHLEREFSYSYDNDCTQSNTDSPDFNCVFSCGDWMRIGLVFA